MKHLQLFEDFKIPDIERPAQTKKFLALTRSEAFEKKYDRMKNSFNFEGKKVYMYEGILCYDAVVMFKDLFSSQTYRDRKILNDYKEEYDKEKKVGVIDAKLGIELRNGRYLVNDGNHRYTAMKEMKYTGLVTARIMIPEGWNR